MQKRDSNLELYRIILMLAIIAHHYVVNSGLMSVLEVNSPNVKNVSFYLLGMWGKTAINCFVLITGYFMCKSKITARKCLKLIFEYEFYTIVIFGVFMFAGYGSLTWKDFFLGQVLLLNISDGFTTCFIVFYFFIPFLNIFIRGMNQRQHTLLIALCLLFFTIIGTIPSMVRMNYVEWFCVLYFISSYIRLYGLPYNKSLRRWAIALVASVIVAMVSVICVVCLIKNKNPYFLVSDSNHIMAVLISVCAFMTFKNLKIPFSNIVNVSAQSVFGVLLIHANSDTMRLWLWKDMVNVIRQYHSEYCFLLAFITIICVFVICVFIDQIRILVIEKPFLYVFDNYLLKHGTLWLRKNY